MLTGLSVRSYGRFADFVTRIAAGRVERGLPWALRRCGYKTYSFYSYLGAFLNARGFQETAGIENFYDAKKLNANGVEPDSFFYDAAARVVEEEKGKQPLFLYVYTVANHFPWDYRFRPDLIVGHSTGDYSAMLASGVINLVSDEAYAETMLEWAEPHNLESIIADTFNNKGSTLGNAGRRREADAIISEAIRIADTGGFINAALRARNNLATIVLDDDPMRALETGREGRDLALRLGNRGQGNWLSGSTAYWAIAAGSEWDAELAILDEALSATGTTAPADRHRMLGIGTIIRMSRGEDATATVKELEALFAQIGDPAAGMGLALVRANWAAEQGRYADAFDEFMRGADIFPAYELLVVPPAMRSAIWLRDQTRAATAVARMEASLFTGRFAIASLVWARAGLVALRGHRLEAVKGFKDAVERLRALGQEFEVALVILDAIFLMPGEPEVRTWADEARAIFERLRAKPSLGRLDAALAKRPPSVVEAETRQADREAAPA